jgi:4-alpha-glucanotransferase
MRRSGILLPIFSLPSNYGIGTFGKEAYEFVDFLVKSKEAFWQILPIGPTSYGDSPYQSFSAFAGNPYFIDLDLLSEEGLLKKSQIEKFDFGNNENYIDYGIMYESRYKVLKIAYNNKNASYEKKLKAFKELNKCWIFDYALFMAIKDYNNGAPWNKWDKAIKFRKPEAMKKYSYLLKKEIEFYIFLQFLFYNQWGNLKNYANKKGIKIIGDIPIYVAEDSSDIWANTKLFMLDDELLPEKVSGCPPDLFSKTGQLWGNPIYNWEQLKTEGYRWWVERVQASLNLFDMIRIDHFRGFESYWAIPYGDKTAVNGKWEKGAGIEVFDAIKKALGEIDVIAEDLGYITDEVRELLNECNFPGMKVMQFAFDPSGDSEYLPHNYNKNIVVYTGTHDNDTIKGWFSSLKKEEKEFCKKYTGMKNADDNWAFVKCAISSVADTVILQMQDILNSGEEARINIPSTIGTNWKWRIRKENMSDELAKKIKDLNEIYRRVY